VNTSASALAVPWIHFMDCSFWTVFVGWIISISRGFVCNVKCQIRLHKFAAWLVLLIANKEVNFNENCM